MNATKETPTPASEDPTRRPLRRALALAAIVVVVVTAGRSAVLITLRPDRDVTGIVAGSFLAGVALVAIASYILMIFKPDLVRRYGLPAVGIVGDERESHLALHAYQVAYTTTLVGTVIYAVAFDSIGVIVISVLTQVAFIGSLIWLNRKV
jgi:hypothetical protein